MAPGYCTRFVSHAASLLPFLARRVRALDSDFKPDKKRDPAMVRLPLIKHASHRKRFRLLLSIFWIVAMAGAVSIRAALPSLDPPEQFFANIADRLLQQQLGLRLGEIQVAPTNQYETAMHRLFQVTANIYDAPPRMNFRPCSGRCSRRVATACSSPGSRTTIARAR